MAFGRILSSDSEGNYKGALMLSLKEGYAIILNLTSRYWINFNPYLVFKIWATIEKSHSFDSSESYIWTHKIKKKINLF